MSEDKGVSWHIMGASIGSSPQTKKQKIIWWTCFAIGMIFIAYVILKNVFGWQ
ncbi:hypothetical protein [Ralstonia sp. ASV6]|uniref:hypothetical protein n=1 Tax=Ralstonia sp. ASV6 TaxID=2795124 RepID=UPI0018ED4709|nr:hypothetical protein [Ralstonia sp. ASV6]